MLALAGLDVLMGTNPFLGLLPGRRRRGEFRIAGKQLAFRLRRPLARLCRSSGRDLSIVGPRRRD